VADRTLTAVADRPVKQTGAPSGGGPVPTGLSLTDAEARGRQDAQNGLPRTACPYQNYPVRGAPRAWRDGWDSVCTPPAAPGAAPPGPPVTTREPVVTLPGGYPSPRHWPTDKALPAVYRRPARVSHPCHKCRAVVVWTRDDMVGLWCRGCQARFKMRAV